MCAPAACRRHDGSCAAPHGIAADALDPCHDQPSRGDRRGNRGAAQPASRGHRVHAPQVPEAPGPGSLSIAASRKLPGMFPLSGGCDCGTIRYRMETEPLFVHCCHCRWCQRETGASFALNAMIEADRVTLLGGEPEIVDTPSASGKGQKIARCPKCRVAVWSNYAGAGPSVHFVRVGTLDEPDRLPPDIHIYTASKQPW